MQICLTIRVDDVVVTLPIKVNTADHGGGRGTMNDELISTMETGRGTSEGELECFVQLSLVNKHNI